MGIFFVMMSFSFVALSEDEIPDEATIILNDDALQDNKLGYGWYGGYTNSVVAKDMGDYLTATAWCTFGGINIPIPKYQFYYNAFVESAGTGRWIAVYITPSGAVKRVKLYY